MADTERPPHESVFQRARHDAARFASTLSGIAILAIWSLACAWRPALIVPANIRDALGTTETQFVAGVLGVLSSILAFLLVQLACAPVRQRDEARRARDTLQALIGSGPRLQFTGIVHAPQHEPGFKRNASYRYLGLQITNNPDSDVESAVADEVVAEVIIEEMEGTRSWTKDGLWSETYPTYLPTRSRDETYPEKVPGPVKIAIGKSKFLYMMCQRVDDGTVYTLSGAALGRGLPHDPLEIHPGEYRVCVRLRGPRIHGAQVALTVTFVDGTASKQPKVEYVD